MKKIDLERYNEWWSTGRVRKELVHEFRRHPLYRLIESLKERQILILTGLRRVGKTTLLYQTIERLLKTVEPKRILYFSFDEGEINVKEVLEAYEREVLSRPFEEAGKIYVFFDEIQYAPGWQSTVKQFYDLYPQIKFFLSGSSTLLLSKEALEKVAGRFFFLEVKPLSFFEFMEMRGAKTSKKFLFSRRMENIQSRQ